MLYPYLVIHCIFLLSDSFVFLRFGSQALSTPAALNAQLALNGLPNAAILSSPTVSVGGPGTTPAPAKGCAASMRPASSAVAILGMQVAASILAVAALATTTTV
jgi:hypothetical protein